jgi:hypothetical protein
MVRHGIAPFYECSSKGDRRFSAFYARLDGKSIEEIYQGAKVFHGGLTGLSPQQAKGKRAQNMDEVRKLYSDLWDRYIAENPKLLDILLKVPGLSDVFGTPGNACQATELWRIRAAHLPESPETPVKPPRRRFLSD